MLSNYEKISPNFILSSQTILKTNVYFVKYFKFLKVWSVKI